MTFQQHTHSVCVKRVSREQGCEQMWSRAKLVRVLRGKFGGVVVDYRSDSKFFGPWTGPMLSVECKRQAWRRESNPQGRLVVSESDDFFHETAGSYARQPGRCIAWCEPKNGTRRSLHSDPDLPDKDMIGRQLRNSTA